MKTWSVLQHQRLWDEASQDRTGTFGPSKTWWSWTTQAWSHTRGAGREPGCEREETAWGSLEAKNLRERQEDGEWGLDFCILEISKRLFRPTGYGAGDGEEASDQQVPLSPYNPVPTILGLTTVPGIHQFHAYSCAGCEGGLDPQAEAELNCILPDVLWPACPTPGKFPQQMHQGHTVHMQPAGKGS